MIQAETLPKTGEEESRSLGIIGTIFVALAGFFGIGRKKKSTDDQDE